MATTQTPSKYVTLVSGDGFEFVVLREATMISPIIKGMLEPRNGIPSVRWRVLRDFQLHLNRLFECVPHRVRLPLRAKSVELTWSANSAVVLDKVVEYFHYWYRYRNSEDVPDMDIPVEICLEVLAAADYLGLDQ
ncbi:hypothetical protein PWT90_09201 [Aphanocladium album]|nr:hypothetical protein PWT90_09201 [Aphanocladium album]